MGEPNQTRKSAPLGDGEEAPAGRGKADLAESEALGGRVQAAAADLTQCEAAFLTLLGEFDAAHASRWWDGIGSTAQWLAWACSIAPVTAREHVRVARALRTLPVIAEAFGRGELSYSKVRTLTRMSGRYKQEKLLQLARAATAAQLARTVSSYRAASGSHADREQHTKVNWSNRADGLVQITAVLLPEDGAAIVTALEDATDQNREDAKNTCPGTEIIQPSDDAADSVVTDGADSEEGTGSGGIEADSDVSRAHLEVPRDQAESREDIARRSRVSAFVGVFQHWLGSRHEDRSGADQTTVVIEVDAAQLANSLATQTVEAAAIGGVGAPAEAHELIVASIAEAAVLDAPAEAHPAVDAPTTAPNRTGEFSEPHPADGASAGASQPPDMPSTAVTGAGGPDNKNVNVGASAEASQPAPDPDQANPAGASAEAIQPPAWSSTAVTGADEPDNKNVNVGASAEASQPAPDPGHATPAGASAEASQPPAVLAETRPSPATSTGTCHVRGHTGLEPDTARRLACEAKVHAIIRGLDGEPLAVSRTKRFGTRAQRRALMVRDKHCQFPGCARQRNLKIHHINHWIDGGPTDLTNLMLLCQHHHTTVHEGHLSITASSGPIRWRFTRPDGSVIVPEVAGLRFEQTLPLLDDGFGGILPDGPARDAAEERRRQLIEENRQHRERVQAQQATLVAAYNDIESGDDPRARRSFPVGGGVGFILANCVEVLFDCELPDPDTGVDTIDGRGGSLGLAA